MLYCANETISANTAEASANNFILQISKGVIKEWWIFAPLEGANLLKLRIFYHGVQIIPINRPKYVLPVIFRGPIVANLEIDTPPYELTIEAWNEDTSKDHEYWVFANVITTKPISPLIEEEGLWEKIKKAAGFD